jgi:hypothetical protein
MNVRELKRLIEHMDDETALVFHDAAMKRRCSIQSATLEPAGQLPAPTLVLASSAPGTEVAHG